MRKAKAELERALTHLHKAQERLDQEHQSERVIQARTLIATATGITRTATKHLRQAEEETCEKP